jgi:hypothetical protein
MADRRIVGKAMNDLGGDWHWIVLHDAHELEPRLVLAASVDTVCGIYIAGGPLRVRLIDTGAPSEPTCSICLDEGGLSPSLREEIEAVIESVEAVPVPA